MDVARESFERIIGLRVGMVLVDEAKQINSMVGTSAEMNSFLHGLE